MWGAGRVCLQLLCPREGRGGRGGRRSFWRGVREEGGGAPSFYELAGEEWAWQRWALGAFSAV